MCTVYTLVICISTSLDHTSTNPWHVISAHEKFWRLHVECRNRLLLLLCADALTGCCNEHTNTFLHASVLDKHRHTRLSKSRLCRPVSPLPVTMHATMDHMLPRCVCWTWTMQLTCKRCETRALRPAMSALLLTAATACCTTYRLLCSRGPCWVMTLKTQPSSCSR